MNREILFRGKRVSDGKWVEGNLFIPDLPTAPTQILIGTNVVRINYDVIPETVGQYTGLVDKNGKKIFEGDILQYEIKFKLRRCGEGVSISRYRHVVLFGDSSFCTREFKDGKLGAYLNPIDDSEFGIDVSDYEVIGNIHDNPELLEEGGD